MAFYAPITTLATRASEITDQAVPNRRDLLTALAGVGLATQLSSASSSAPPKSPLLGQVAVPSGRSPIEAAAEAIRVHNRAYNEEQEDDWATEGDRLQQAFACTPAHDLHELAAKMKFVLEDDLLDDYARHNSMVNVMAQLQIWARSAGMPNLDGPTRPA